MCGLLFGFSVLAVNIMLFSCTKMFVCIIFSRVISRLQNVSLLRSVNFSQDIYMQLLNTKWLRLLEGLTFSNTLYCYLLVRMNSFYISNDCCYDMTYIFINLYILFCSFPSISFDILVNVSKEEER